MEKHRLAALFFDLGDTIMIEATEVKDSTATTQSADLISGMADLLRALKARGFRLALVADTRPGTAMNVLGQHGLLDLFEFLAISEHVGAEKPDPRMFRAAMDALGIPDGEHERCVMVGNNLARDITGANRLGMISVFFNWQDRQRSQPANDAEIPRYRAATAQELQELIDFLDCDGSQPPQAGESDPGLDIAERYAPRILFDNAEPFLPLAVGYTIFQDEADSPSFPRRITQGHRPHWRTAVEYAIWWDWDIGHLYELEHAWSYIDAGGRLVWAEASWHGDYQAMINAGDAIPCVDAHPVIIAQPGKHAFAPEPICFQRVVHFVMTDAGRDAGEGGVLVKDQYRERIHVRPGDDELVGRYLRGLAFTPTMKFEKEFQVPRRMLVPWPVLNAWIPARVNWWLEQLRVQA